MREEIIESMYLEGWRGDINDYRDLVNNGASHDEALQICEELRNIKNKNYKDLKCKLNAEYGLTITQII